jgi:hypothetical protein
MNRFIFNDNENNYILVEWDFKTFEKEYVKLTKKYNDDGNCERFYFYDDLYDILKPKWVLIDFNIERISENVLNFNN